MPKKKPPPDEAEPQIERFRKAVRDIEAAGELSPSADDDFERAIATSLKPRPGEG